MTKTIQSVLGHVCIESESRFMKINALGGYNLNLISNLNFKQKEPQNSSFGLHTISISRELPKDKISFTGVNAQIPFFLKVVDNIPCPCCGIKMVKSSDIALKLGGDVLTGPSAHSIEALYEFEDSMHPIEKACFGAIKSLGKKNPEMPLNELLLSVKELHLEKLKITEFKVLNQLDKLGKQLSPMSAKKLSDITDAARFSIKAEDSDVPFKRKTVLDRVLKLKAHIPEKKVAEELLKVAHKLPSSGTNVDAFMVKYSRRSSKEIGLRLVSPSIGTVEHIRPKSIGGENNDKNYLLECAGCNNSRGNISLEDWVKIHPEMSDNIQKNMDAVIEKINSGIIKGYNWYPAEIAKTVAEESKGVLKINISKMKFKSNVSIITEALIEKFKTSNPRRVKRSSDELASNTNPFDTARKKKKKQ